MKILIFYAHIFILAGIYANIFSDNTGAQPNKLQQEAAVVCGAGGFIGHHLVKELKAEGYWVRGVDIKYPEFTQTEADEFILGDLRDPKICEEALKPVFSGKPIDYVYQLAADVGGIGYIVSHDAQIMSNSIRINVNMLEAGRKAKINKIYFSSSSCVYPEYNQKDPKNSLCIESMVYPALPDTEYGWEKLFSERLYLAYARDYGINVRIGRYFNIFGPEETWQGGREKVVAALCRKIACAPDGDEIAVWGTGEQTRAFVYVDECVQATIRLMKSDFGTPVNIGTGTVISINELANLIAKIAGKNIKIKNTPGPVGVQGKKSDNSLITNILHWQPSSELTYGLRKTYLWVKERVETN